MSDSPKHGRVQGLHACVAGGVRQSAAWGVARYSWAWCVVVAGGTQRGETREGGRVPLAGHGTRWPLCSRLAGWGTCTALTRSALSLGPRLVDLEWVNPQEYSVPGALLAGEAASACAALLLAGGVYGGVQGGKWQLLHPSFPEKFANTL